jgi:uncharacterized protein (DUF169 family)
MNHTEKLQGSLPLSLAPIAVSMVDAVPEGVPRFEGAVPAGCVFWERAAKGMFATSTGDHELCAIGVYTHNLAAPSAQQGVDLKKALEVMQQLDYVRPEDVAAIPVMARPVRHVVYGPLDGFPLAPDVVLLFTNGRGSLILSEAAQQLEAAVAPAMGRPACAVVPQVMNSGRAALSLGCCGARAYLDALRDDVALWALPGKNIGAYVERIVSLARANEVLGGFHAKRRQRVEAGDRPTVAESLADMS